MADRDYKAEYARRLQLGRARGQTTAQARRGGKKYATAQPREHVQREATARRKYGVSSRQVTKQRLARRHVRGYNAPESHAQQVQRFHSLNKAMDFASELPRRSNIYIVGHGTVRHANKYKGKQRGWASLSQVSRPNRYVSPVRREELAKRDREIFDPDATTYEVRWSEE